MMPHVNVMGLCFQLLLSAVIKSQEITAMFTVCHYTLGWLNAFMLSNVILGCYLLPRNSCAIVSVSL